MATTIQGTKQDPARVDVQIADDKWTMSVDLAALPPSAAIKAVRRVFKFQTDHVYVYRTQYIDRVAGATKEVISRATVAKADVEVNQVNPVGFVDSPLSLECWDIT